MTSKSSISEKVSKSALLLGSLLLALAVLGLIFLFCSSIFAKGSKHLDPLVKEHREREHGSPLMDGSNPSKFKKEQRTASKDPNTQALEIDSLAIGIVKALKDDEAARSNLVRRTESPDRVSFIFQINRNPDLEKLVSELCQQSSEEAEVNPIALRTKLNEQISEFVIPEGLIQKVFIEVPFDTDEMSSFMSAICSDQGPADGIINASGPGVAGRVLAGNIWRYDRLIDLGQPEKLAE